MLRLKHPENSLSRSEDASEQYRRVQEQGRDSHKLYTRNQQVGSQVCPFPTMHLDPFLGGS